MRRTTDSDRAMIRLRCARDPPSLSKLRDITASALGVLHAWFTE